MASNIDFPKVSDAVPSGPVPEAMAGLPGWLASWLAKQVAAEPEPPAGGLYHYTDTPGLIGIFKTNELWATNALYTNDQAELFHSLILLTRLVNEAQTNRAEDVATDMMLIAAEEFGTIIEVFIVCFCRNGDLLSQWRGYGPIAGYSLGFDGGILKGLEGRHVRLAPVRYSEVEQSKLVRELVSEWRNLFKGAPADQFPQQVRRLGAFVFAQAFSFLAATFKREGFAEEDEWRLFYRRQAVLKDDADLAINFRERKGFPASYARIPLPVVSDRITPVRHVFLGPTAANWNLAGFAVSRLMQSAGYVDEAIRISPSRISLRP